jgi:endonuclease/exonuclease/phosphatase family metal-dependent hydrolase
MRPVTFRTATINVKSNPEMRQASVVHDVRKASRQASIIGWQEIEPERYRQAIRDLPPTWSHFMPKGSTNPISWRNDEWKKVGGRSITTHEGRAGVTPHRNITWVKLQHRETGQEVVRINTHLISGAWSDPKPTTGWRREQWHEHRSQLNDLVRHFEKQGAEVIVGGDFNRDSFKVLGDRVRYDNSFDEGTHGRRTLDYLMHTKGPELVNLGTRVQGGYASDHDAVIGRYRLR